MHIAADPIQGAEVLLKELCLKYRSSLWSRNTWKCSSLACAAQHLFLLCGKQGALTPVLVFNCCDEDCWEAV